MALGMSLLANFLMAFTKMASYPILQPFHIVELPYANERSVYNVYRKLNKYLRPTYYSI